jgi:hypothetical protein
LWILVVPVLKIASAAAWVLSLWKLITDAARRDLMSS